jgi:DNA polymerase II small subunit/DNA polymerase delta subunit B
MARKALRVVTEQEREEPMSLLEAVESGDILAIMKAQRRGIAEAWVAAAENTKPQFDQRLEKLNALIREEESRRAVESADESVVAPLEPTAWDGTGY